MAKLATIAGYAPFIGGGLIDPVLGTALCSVFSEMGVRFAVQHGRAVNLGETSCGLALKPEHIDLKLFEHVGRDGATVLDEAIDSAPSQPGAVAPYFVGVKMHDNDFFPRIRPWPANDRPAH